MVSPAKIFQSHNFIKEVFSLVLMKQKYALLTIFVTVFIDMIGIGIVLPILGPLFLDKSISILPQAFSIAQRTMLLGFLIASYPLAQFFGAPMLGALSDHHGRKKLGRYPRVRRSHRRARRPRGQVGESGEDPV